MRYLVVADSAEARELLCCLLLSLGVQGLPAETPERARRELASQPDIDGAIIDVDDPAAGGRELLAALKSDPATSSLTLIAHTGQSRPETVAALAESGVAGCLLKPAGRPEALETLKNIIARAAGPGPSRRRHVRVSPPADELLRLHFRVSGVPGLVSGRITDLSMGGLAFELMSPKAADALKPETFIERLQFALRGRELSPSGVVAAAKGRKAGVRFTSLTPEDSIALARYLFDKTSG